MEGALSSGETHTYRAELAAGHAWRIAVEQRGIDVEVAAQGPDGRRTVVDGPFDRQGTETLVIEPAGSGTFEIAVTAREPVAPAGRYEIRLDELPSDRAAAEEAMSRAGSATARARRRGGRPWRNTGKRPGSGKAWGTAGRRRAPSTPRRCWPGWRMTPARR